LAGTGSVVAERRSARVESARLLRVGLIGLGIGMPLMVAAPAMGFYLAGVVVYGLSLGTVDATTNMQAVALEHRYQRPILPSFHGAWTFGALIGAGVSLATGGLPLAASGVLGLVAIAAAGLRFEPRESVPASALGVDPALAGTVPWRPIILVGAGMVVFYMVDTASQTWGATYLDVALEAPSELVALATIPYLVVSLLIRLAGDGLVARYGAVPVLRTGAVVACLGLLVVTLAPTWPVAILGFTVVGLGICVVAPLSFSAAATIAGAGTAAGSPVDRGRVDVVIARFNQFNYVGGLLGAVLTGVVGRNDLRFGFVIPMVLVLTLIPLARHFVGIGGGIGGVTAQGTTQPVGTSEET